MLLVLLGLTTSRLQEKRPWTPETPKSADAEGSAADPMTWERDFDLLIEVEKIPTKGQLLRQAKRDELMEELDQVQRRLDDSKKRLKALDTSYTTDLLMEEMIRQGVPDLQSVEKNLKDQIRKDSARATELQILLKRLDQPGGK